MLLCGYAGRSLALSLLAVVVVGQDFDGTVRPLARGASIVETVCLRIESSCIFPEDKLFLRRLAYVESSDGSNPATFRSGYHGGIWQVDRNVFDALKSNEARSFLRANFTTAIQRTFGISWDVVRWEDLTKPLYSALAARLYISYQLRQTPIGIPRSLEEQAKFWRTHWRPNGNVVEFVRTVDRLTRGCKSIGADVIFLMDGSGSISTSDFTLMKTFVNNSIASFDVGFGAKQNRFGIIQFSTSVKTEFNLSSFGTMEEISAAIDRISKLDSGTKTYLGIDTLVKEGFSRNNGARPKELGHPRVGIVLTDGESDDKRLTELAAKRAQEADITLISVGFGSGINQQELETIASVPTCLHVIRAVFAESDSLKYVVEKRACEAPIVVSMNQTSATEFELQAGAEQNFKIKVPRDGATMRFDTKSGTKTTYYLSKSTYPSKDYYDEKVESRPGRSGALFIPMNKTDEHGNVFGHIESDNTTERSIALQLVAGDADHCKEKPCRNGETCYNNFTNAAFICECEPENSGQTCDATSFGFRSTSLTSVFFISLAMIIGSNLFNQNFRIDI